MTEHRRWFWRMDEYQRHDYSSKTVMWFESMLARFHREAPIEFAGFQFDCAMKLERMRESRP